MPLVIMSLELANLQSSQDLLYQLSHCAPQSTERYIENTRCLLISSLPVRPFAGPRSAVGNVSGYRCVSDCRSRGREFDPGPVPYFRGD